MNSTFLKIVLAVLFSVTTVIFNFLIGGAVMYIGLWYGTLSTTNLIIIGIGGVAFGSILLFSLIAFAFGFIKMICPYDEFARWWPSIISPLILVAFIYSIWKIYYEKMEMTLFPPICITYLLVLGVISIVYSSQTLGK